MAERDDRLRDKVLQALRRDGGATSASGLRRALRPHAPDHEHGAALVPAICDGLGGVEIGAAIDEFRPLAGIIGRSGFVPACHVADLYDACASCGRQEIRR